MAKRDLYHKHVKHALIKDGWTITHDPFPLKIGTRNLAADLGAERLISAEKGHQKIVVEVKSFVGTSDVRELQQAVGQYDMYLRILNNQHSDRRLYLAIPISAFQTLFTIELGQLFLRDEFLRLIVFNPKQEVITQWIPA
jgi:hypothetical protein